MYMHGGDVYGNVEVLDFSANINFRGMPESVLKAAHNGVDMSVHYPQPQSTGLTKAVASYYYKTGLMTGFDEENFIFGNGAAEVIFGFMNAVRPKKALMPVPTFHEYEQALGNLENSCEIKKYYLSKDNSFDLDWNILEYITYDTGLVCICNPNNPTGRLADKTVLRQIISRCKETGAWLFIDESFMELVEDGRERSICGELDRLANDGFDKIFVLKSFTKLFAMPGLRLGYGICADKKLIGRMREDIQPWNVSLPAQLAGIAAIEELDKNSFDEVSAEMTALERAGLYEAVSRFFKVYEGAANFLLFEFADEPYEGWLYDRCLERGILIRSCCNFEGLGKGWYRIAVKNREDNMKLAEILSCILNH